MIGSPYTKEESLECRPCIGSFLPVVAIENKQKMISRRTGRFSGRCILKAFQAHVELNQLREDHNTAADCL